VPVVKDGPKGLNNQLEAVYSSCMSGQKDTPANQTSCSKQAWAAVKNAGWKKVKGKWSKPKSKRV